MPSPQAGDRDTGDGLQPHHRPRAITAPISVSPAPPPATRCKFAGRSLRFWPPSQAIADRLLLAAAWRSRAGIASRGAMVVHAPRAAAAAGMP